MKTQLTIHYNCCRWLVEVDTNSYIRGIPESPTYPPEKYDPGEPDSIDFEVIESEPDMFEDKPAEDYQPKLDPDFCQAVIDKYKEVCGE
jgi:hypothetical protein